MVSAPPEVCSDPQPCCLPRASMYRASAFGPCRRGSLIYPERRRSCCRGLEQGGRVRRIPGVSHAVPQDPGLGQGGRGEARAHHQGGAPAAPPATPRASRPPLPCARPAPDPARLSPSRLTGARDTPPPPRCATGSSSPARSATTPGTATSPSSSSPTSSGAGTAGTTCTSSATPGATPSRPWRGAAPPMRLSARPGAACFSPVAPLRGC